MLRRDQQRRVHQAITALQNIVTAEPDAAYAYYYLGEAYRFKKDPSNALQSYNLAVEKNPNFGPGYVGVARARLMLDPNANVIPLLDEAIRLDPNLLAPRYTRAVVSLQLHYAKRQALTPEAVADIDRVIAGQAKARDLTLVTHNTTEFQRVPGLKVEDWKGATPSPSPPSRLQRSQAKPRSE